jgi:hypothetical protein
MKLSLFSIIPFCGYLYKFYHYYLLGVNETSTDGWANLYSHASLYLWIMFLFDQLIYGYLLILLICVLFSIKEKELNKIDKIYANYGWVFIAINIVLGIGQLFLDSIYII